MAESSSPERRSHEISAGTVDTIFHCLVTSERDFGMPLPLPAFELSSEKAVFGRQRNPDDLAIPREVLKHFTNEDLVRYATQVLNDSQFWTEMPEEMPGNEGSPDPNRYTKGKLKTRLQKALEEGPEEEDHWTKPREPWREEALPMLEEGIKAVREAVTGQIAGTEKAAPKMTMHEEYLKWLGDFKTRFKALPQLHQGIEWEDVERSLDANPEFKAKIIKLDFKGHKMNVFGERNGELIFVSGWDDVRRVSFDHRNVVYDKSAQADKDAYGSSGNAVDIAESLGGNLAYPEFNRYLTESGVKILGWAYFRTHEITRKDKRASVGDARGINDIPATTHSNNGSFRVELRLKKV